MKLRLALLLALVGACFAPTRQAAPCVSDENCNLSAGGQCLPSPLGVDQCAYPDPACPSGLSWGELSPSLHGQCTSDVDAGVDAIDAREADATDAAIDGPPVGPVVTTYQPADLVLGQQDLTTATQGLPSTASSTSAQSPAFDNGVLWIGDSSRARVLAWVPQPQVNNAPAARVTGRSNFTDTAIAGTPSATNLSGSADVSAAGGKLAIADTGFNRVLLWNAAPLSSGIAAAIVLGQPGFTTSGFGNGPTQMHIPTGVWTDGTRLAVAESINGRVLIWTSFPTRNGQPADIILGDGTTSQANAISMAPSSVYSDGQRFYVVDRGRNRVMVWNSFPTMNAQPADFVIGQPDFATRTPGRSASKLDQPVAVAATSDALFVSDFSNDRVLVYSPIPTAGGAAATYVLGQPDMVTGGNNPAATAQSLDGPMGVAVAPDGLWVADRLHNRAVRFRLYQ